MGQEREAKITAKGQVTIPSAIRAALGVGPGDRLLFAISDAGAVQVRPIKRRSILDIADQHPIPTKHKLGDLDALIEKSIDAAAKTRERRGRRGARP